MSGARITLELADPVELADKIRDLHRIHFASRDSAAKRRSYIDWLLSNPVDGSIYLAAYVDGAFASFLGFMARRVVGFGREFRGALAFGAMTRPEFAGRGLYRRLAHVGWDEARRRGFDFAMGYTTRGHVLQMELRMGWQHLGAAPVVALPIDCEAVVRAAVPSLGSLCVIGRPLRFVARRLARSRASSVLRRGISVSKATEFSPAYDAFSEALRGADVISFSKDFRTLSWLYLSPYNPFTYEIAEAWRGGELVGFAVGREMDLLGLRGYGIMDLVALPGHEDVLAPVAASLVLSALEKDLRVVAAMVSDRHPIRSALASLGFISSRTHFALIFRPTSDSLGLDRVARPENWSNLWGNNDTV